MRSDVNKTKEYHKKWYAKNRARILAKNSVWQKANPEKRRQVSRRSWIRRKYGISEEQYNDLIQGVLQNELFYQGGN